jgi:hypothetical protein
MEPKDREMFPKAWIVSNRNGVIDFCTAGGVYQLNPAFGVEVYDTAARALRKAGLSWHEIDEMIPGFTDKYAFLLLGVTHERDAGDGTASLPDGG